MSLSDPNPLQTFADRLALHSGLDSDERRAVAALPAHAAQVQANRDFVRLGEKVDHACYIVEGLVGRFEQNREGVRQIAAVHIPGDMADLHSVVAPEAGSALQALTVTTILRVPHDALRALARKYPRIAEAFWRECVADAAILAEWVVNVGRRNALARMSHLLCELACRCEATGQSSRLDFQFAGTQNQLADMLGLTSVHVNRTLRVLKENKMVASDGRRVRILDWEELARLGEFNADYLKVRGTHRQPATIAA
jgi:CRP-like cAMP-binding protein